MMCYQKKPKGFTLIEVLLVVAIIGVIATLSMTNYYKAVERTHLMDAVSALKMIHKAQQMYFVKNEQYFPRITDDDNRPLGQINQALNLGLYGNDFDYVCSHGAGADFFVCTATRQGNAYRVVVNQNDLDGVNPECQPLNQSCP